MTGYTYIWEFQVKPEQEASFLEHYGSEGIWVQLFKQAPGFIETLLLRDRDVPYRYVTVDRWQSAAAYQAFRTQFAEAYAALDRACESLTSAEREIGTFDG
ncbi:antibiotic biosynthesis monooxygenase family protein [Dyella acidisoli]|uniref:ABM domain-containing protein n=1 Tax=Dyella acidisoli TaxID=1867834 RepID=A0ABQ5XNE2_9GAMM|nr:antibiotic biosynthesis monooxygenase family protein [Dyella acidisoli]GLQ92040.1 hypothetical protein GCM10007901_09910 [Dyella acidisoli]